MSDKNPVEQEVADPREDSAVDRGRRSFARIGVGAPVIMSLASQPVFGANCLSNALSGNLSDPDRGECEPGVSISAIRAAGNNWGGVYNGKMTIAETPLAEMSHIFPVRERNSKQLRWYIENGTPLQQLAIGAMVNTSLSPTYMLTQEHLLRLLRGDLPAAYGEINARGPVTPVPYGMSVEEYLSHTMPEY